MVHFNQDPFVAWGAELGRLQRHADRFVSNLLTPAAPETGPSVNLYHTDEGLVLVARMPGLTAAELDVRVEEGVLILEGKPAVVRQEGASAETETDEPKSLAFTRRVRLPFAIDPEKVEARLEHGLLVLRAPRQTPETRTIHINTQG